MLDERMIDDIYMVAEKMDRGEELTLEEQAFFDDIQEDGETYRAFCLFTAMMDMPEIFAEEKRKKDRQKSFYWDREDIDRRIAKNVGSTDRAFTEKKFSK